ncbi:hypothetical protein N7499_002567 [Penicillium canescens]|uniref:Uncharacterized protein n=1 Tax=Penicillium canescens TaxID=5083 RepID=A0AAD6I7Q9_PENCN|nr:uncharacterized protein N7446_010177 [Penicillium canescens]KAJ6001519.1 hypothetical protein N7522_006746 [Penicillium canescens]KAJ6035416.1 hypothetical protein N7460_009591 [Penicillium canescens]KAJ6037541.1 hypothetical protein N7444_010246 [Penicillium canescens]KAJ6054165.1 hypothetical protein N7446_010177 [Penicillium canescens]KAJ6098193.1 hypothetical protein N7499_002567 [Penicillium canescens]
MTFPYKHVLLIGATSGIGRAMADRLAESGLKVTAVGRRQERLDKFVRMHGEDKASSVAFDLADIKAIPGFVESVTKTFPDIDCVFFNAGVQHIYDMSDPTKFDLDQFQNEVSLNFNSFVALTHAILPFLTSKNTPTSLIFTGSNLAIVPAVPMPAYCASKAALNVFVLCLREQLSKTNVKVIEISPPLVQTELHDYMGEEKGRGMGMPLGQFIHVTHEGLLAGKDQIVVGSVGSAEVFNDILDKRRSAFDELAKMMRSNF